MKPIMFWPSVEFIVLRIYRMNHLLQPLHVMSHQTIQKRNIYHLLALNLSSTITEDGPRYIAVIERYKFITFPAFCFYPYLLIQQQFRTQIC